MGGADADDSAQGAESSYKAKRAEHCLNHRGQFVAETMTKPEARRSGMPAVSATGRCATGGSAAEQVNNGSVEPDCLHQSTPVKAKMIKQTSRESLHRRNTECEVYDDGTNTFFW